MTRTDFLTKRFGARAAQAFSAGPQHSGVVAVAATSTAPAELLIYDFIGSDFFGEGVTAKSVLAALAKAGDGPVTVRVNSPGGDVWEGMAIFNALQAHKGGVTTVVDGLAASAASFIALAGSSLAMNAASMFMIHNARTMAFGPKADMLAVADTLGKIDGTLADIYAAKTGKPAADMAALMDAETWMTSAEAQAGGFADTVLPPPAKAKAKAAEPENAVAAVFTANVEAMRRRLRVRESA